MTAARYLTSFIFPVLTAIALWRGGAWGWVVPVVTFGLVPLLELVLPARPFRPGDDELAARTRSPWFDAALYGVALAHLAVVAGLLVGVSSGHVAGWDLPGAIVSVGVSCGAFGINLGHELGHRRSAGHRAAAIVLLATSLYAHFYVEHNRGHHTRVATEDDPASARRGETVFAFWWRSITTGAMSAWALEADRLRKRGVSAWSWRNQTLALWLGEAAALLVALVTFGPLATACWAASASFGVLLLETVNYIEHYGLVRDTRPDGRRDKVRPEHSWNADHPLGRLLLFELTLHSDHHASPHRAYPALRSFTEAPQLPTGYPGMMVLSMVPPLYFRVMDRALTRDAARRRAA
jgi:alkane 1-monooxygenase